MRPLHWWNQGCRKHTRCLACCVHWCCVPMSSEKPPTGSRQVPVTNWSRRILFSLSISFTTCRNKPIRYCNTYTTGLCVFRSVDYSMSIPARTSESACCSSCSVYKWCSSANRPNRSPAYHRASAATHRTTGSDMCPPCFMGALGQDRVESVCPPLIYLIHHPQGLTVF